MIGSKLRSWMEAVRPRKKQNRKEKMQKAPTEPPPRNQILPHDSKSHDALSCSMASDGKSTETLATQPRYSGTNLSSPESAYSTGYSTDGTSPGAPPEYYINIRTKTRYFPSNSGPTATQPPPHQHAETIQYPNPPDIPDPCSVQKPTTLKAVATLTEKQQPASGQRIGNEVVAVVMSPRQRNRIRTNPWVASSASIPGSPRLDALSEGSVQPTLATQRYLSPSVEKRTKATSSGPYIGCDTLSSSSCSSLSATSLHCALPAARHRQPAPVRNGSLSDDEDDRTLNEMMGKYDESYVYEKETDILSDSDPTDCETDIDTGQDGGDEDEEDPMDDELDFIDNGSFLEFGIGDLHDQNKGHCTYHSFHAELSSRNKSCRRRDFHTGSTQRERRRERSSKKSKHVALSNKQTTNSRSVHSAMLSRLQMDGSRSAGATPVSARRTPRPISKLAIEDSPAKLKWRSNSVSLSRPTFDASIDRRDQEADKKYKELIIEAEHILMSMKGAPVSSPRRAPGLPNKRVELLRYAETSCNSPVAELFLNNKNNHHRLIEDVPSITTTTTTTTMQATGCSPKKNHITNFINNNSPVAVRRTIEAERRLVDNNLARHSPVMRSRSPKSPKKHSASKDSTKASGGGSRNTHGSPKHEQQKRGRSSSGRRNKFENKDESSSEESDCLAGAGNVNSSRAVVAFRDVFSCPQSEPVKRKVYMGHVGVTASEQRSFHQQYSITKEVRPYTNANIPSTIEHTKNSTDNQMSSLRRQVLLNTIANLKRNLESQSASLQQVYSSAQNIPAWASKH